MRVLVTGAAGFIGSFTTHRLLERGDVALEESISLYERGAQLKKRCEDKLKDAEEKVAAITLDGDGNPVGTKPVEGL